MMNKQSGRELNLMLAVSLAVGALLVAGGVHLLHDFQMRRTATVMLARGETAREEGNLDKAIKYYTYYANYVPTDDRAFSTLAMLIADKAEQGANRGAFVRAFFMLEAGVRRDPNNVEVLRRLADYSMKIGRMSDATEHLTRLIQQFPEDSELEVKLGRCQVATEHFREAIGSFESVIGRARDNLEAYVALANVLRENLDDSGRAEAVIDQMVSANPKAAKAYLQRSRYRRMIEAGEGARKDIAEAMALSPDDVEVLVMATRLAMDEKDFKKAHGYLDRARRLHPDNEQVHLRMSELLILEGGKDDKAIEQLLSVVDKKASDPAVLFRLAELQLKQGDLDGVGKTIKKMRAAGYRSEIAEYFESRIQIARGKWREASYALERLRPTVEDLGELGSQVDLLLGLCYEQLRIPDRQLAAYQRVLKKTPGLVAARLGYASALSRTGKTQEAQKEYLALEKGLGSEKFLEASALRNGLFRLIVVNTMRLPEDKRDWSELNQFVGRVEKIEGIDGVQKMLMRADLLVKKGQLKEALALVVAERDKNPKQLTLWTALANLTAMEKGPKAALEVLEKAADKVGDNVGLRLARASLAVRLGSRQGLPILETVALNDDKLPEADKVRLWRGLGSAYYQLRNRKRANKYWKLVANARPNDAQIRLALFELAREAGSEAGMSEASDALKKLLGRQSSEWNYAEAARLVWMTHHRKIDRKALGTAKQHLEVAIQRRPNWHEIPRLEAEIAVLEGRLDDAIGCFQRAAGMGQLSPVHLGQLVRLLYTRGRYAEAKDVMGLLARRGSPTMEKLEAELDLRTGNLDSALELAKESVAGSDRAADFLWYGQLLVRAKNNKEAQKAFRKAVELDPRISEGWFALVALLVEADKKEEAEEVVLQAQMKLSEDRVALVLAQCYQLLGDPVRAEQQYLNAVALHPEEVRVLHQVARFYLRIGKRDKARKYLAQLLGLCGRDPRKYRNDLLWSRRSLARLLATDGNYRGQQRALKLLDENAQGKESPIEDLRLKAAILASRADRKSQLKAIKILEGNSDKQKSPLPPRDKFLLAQLYEKTDRWSLCREQLLDLLATHPKNVVFLGAYLQMLFRHDSPPGAIRPWVDKLAELQPDAPATIAMKARLMVKIGKIEEAVTLLRSLIPRPLPPNQVGRLREIAMFLEKLEQFHEAKKLLVEFSEKEPSGKLSLAAFLGRRKTIETVDQALDLCENAMEDAPKVAVLRIAVGVLRQNHDEITDKHLRRVEVWFEHAEKEEADSKIFLLQLAGLRNLQGKYTELVETYRKFLDRDDVSDQEKALVANNLAFILATGGTGGKEALKLVDFAMSVRGPAPELLDTRAMAFLAMGQNKAAISDLRQAISDNPSAIKYFHLALAHYAANDQRSALRAMQSARNIHRLRIEDIPKIEREKYKKLIISLGV